jgi:SAM-dependent methyltransferase
MPPVSERRARFRGTFEAAAAIYDRARPAYPEELFDDLVRLARLRPTSRLLEVGCGTGKATLPLARRGFAIVCLELGAELARRARANLRGYPVEVRTAAFESWDARGDRFDLVYAATSWHWIEPEVRYRKAHHVLAPDGSLAFWSAGHAFPDGFDPFFAEIQEVYDAIGEGHPDEWPPPPPDAVPDKSAEILASGLFEHVRVRRYVWEVDYTAEEYIALLSTFSGHIAMEAAKREHLFREIRARLAGREKLRRHWLAVLHVARRARATASRPSGQGGSRRSR